MVGDNLMKINADKCHFLVSTNNTFKIEIGNFYITNSKSKKLLRVKFDHKLLRLVEKFKHCHK